MSSGDDPLFLSVGEVLEIQLRMLETHGGQPALSMLRIPNPALRWVLLGASVFLAVALLVPFARRLFRFAPVHITDLLLSLAAGFTCVLWFEIVKAARGKPAT